MMADPELSREARTVGAILSQYVFADGVADIAWRDLTAEHYIGWTLFTKGLGELIRRGYFTVDRGRGHDRNRYRVAVQREGKAGYVLGDGRRLDASRLEGARDQRASRPRDTHRSSVSRSGDTTKSSVAISPISVAISSPDVPCDQQVSAPYRDTENTSSSSGPFNNGANRNEEEEVDASVLRERKFQAVMLRWGTKDIAASTTASIGHDGAYLAGCIQRRERTHGAALRIAIDEHPEWSIDQLDAAVDPPRTPVRPVRTKCPECGALTRCRHRVEAAS